MALSKGFVQNSAATPLDARLMDGARFVKNPDGSVRTGVLWSSGSGGNVVGSQATMNVVVVSADFVLSRSATDGALVLSNRGTVVVPIPAAPASNSQYHVVYVKQNDGGSGGQGDADSTSGFFVASGTPAASPTVPTVPTGGLALATVLVPTGVTATSAAGVVITNVFQNTALYGAPVTFATLTALRAAVPAAETLGRVAGNGGSIYRYTSAAWVPLNGTAFAQRVGSAGAAVASGSTFSQLPLADSAFSSDTAVISTPSGVLTAVSAGYYRVTARVNWAANSTGSRAVEAFVNGSSITQRVADERLSSVGSGQGFAHVVSLPAGAAVSLFANQTSGVALAYTATLTLELVALT